MLTLISTVLIIECFCCLVFRLTDCLWMKWFVLINVSLPENNLNIEVINCPNESVAVQRRDEAFFQFPFPNYSRKKWDGDGITRLRIGSLPCCASLDTWYYCSGDESINVPTLHITQLKPLWHTPRSGFLKISDSKHSDFMQAWRSGYCRAFSSSCSDRKGVAFFFFLVPTGESCVWWFCKLTNCLIFLG